MNTNETLFENLASIVWYNGLEEQLRVLRRELECKNRLPRQNVDLSAQGEIFFMILVFRFGDYGVSPRYGWIEDFDGAVEFIDKLLKLAGYGES